MSEEQVKKEDIQAYLDDIEEKLLESGNAYLHSLIALDEILRHPKSAQLLDSDMKTQLRDLWSKIKESGIQLDNPPLLYGLPEDFGIEAKDEEISVE